MSEQRTGLVRMLSRAMSMTSQPEPDYSTIELTWKDVRCVVPSRKDRSETVDILKGVSGYARTGTVTSIMGPSGAGKSTLMDILAGRIGQGTTVTGDLLVNGKPVNRRVLRKSICYVMQHDHLPHTDTVREVLIMNAALRLPRAMAFSEKLARVDATMKELGLEVCADTLVGSEAHNIKGISGGQMRRLSVAQELITSPSCIFLDEPSSGLDSEIAVSIMETLADLASRGRTIMFTIHQPNSDITELFDDFILMSRGHIVYAGPWMDAMSFFQKAGFPCPQFKNPTDHFMRIVANDEAGTDNLIELHRVSWEASEPVRAEADRNREAREKADATRSPSEAGLVAVDVGNRARIIARPNSTASAFVLTQAYYLVARNFRMWRRHPLMIMGEGIQYVFLALFVGGMYYNMSKEVTVGTFERGAGLFYILVTIVFTPPFTAVAIYNSERGLLRRESNQQTYSITSFYVSKLITLMPMEACGTLVVAVISYFMFGLQRDAGKFFTYALIMLLSLLIAESLGLMMAIVTKSAEIAIVLMSLVFIVVLSFTGFLTPETPVYYAWIQHLSFLRYGNSALFINEMDGLTLYTKDGIPVSGASILVGNPLNSGLSLWANIGVLAGIFVFLRFVNLAGIHLAKRRNWL